MTELHSLEHLASMHNFLQILPQNTFLQATAVNKRMSKFRVPVKEYCKTRAVLEGGGPGLWDRTRKLITEFDIIKLPLSITEITFSDRFNKPLSDLTFSTIRIIKFGDYFNHPVNNLLPNTLQFLTFGSNFNQMVDQLPSSLLSLQFGTFFNSPVDLLPSTLIKLVFDTYFDQPVNHLPQSLIHLAFGPSETTSNMTRFNQPLDHLPNNLTNLFLNGRFFDKPLDHLPKSVRYLRVYTYPDGFNPPDTLTHLVINSCVTIAKLPKNLTHLIFGIHCHYNITLDNILPANLTTIYFGRAFNQRVDNLPNSVTKIVFGIMFNQALDNLPSSLLFLAPGNLFDHPLNHLPRSLTHLVFHHQGNADEYRSRFNDPLDFLPSSLLVLVLPEGYRQPLQHLPFSLHTVMFPQNYKLPTNFSKKNFFVQYAAREYVRPKVKFTVPSHFSNDNLLNIDNLTNSFINSKL